MDTIVLLGFGYTAQRLAPRLAAAGWEVRGVNRSGLPVSGQDVPVTRFYEAGEWIASADAILASVPPEGEDDPVLLAHRSRLSASWIGYLSSTGVYGDTRGAWVDENSPIGMGRRSARTAADLAWQTLGAHVFRLPGIYGPGRSALDRVRAGTAHRIDKPGHVFCRIHVDDIGTAILASLAQPNPGTVYNIADDEPASGNAVIEFACDLLGLPYPKLQSLDEAGLSAMGRAFYSECRRVRAARMKSDLGVRLAFPTYRDGLRAVLAEEQR
jgi:nucleoside-diphosphate-sugar epimerase